MIHDRFSCSVLSPQKLTEHSILLCLSHTCKYKRRTLKTANEKSEHKNCVLTFSTPLSKLFQLFKFTKTEALTNFDLEMNVSTGVCTYLVLKWRILELFCCKNENILLRMC